MSIYGALISKAIGSADPQIAGVIEEIMRTDRTGLDGLSLPQFNQAARLAYADVQTMAAAGCLHEYCDALGIATPGGA